ncbi:MAG: helix-turn-helix transcriptional regulator, partial [Clostridia bacterium]|nr:helix-turn-helix transcriptional regulator [Clostridia bacterium]
LFGVTPQAVSKWERELSCPDITLLPAIAKVLGVSVGYLLGEGA